MHSPGSGLAFYLGGADARGVLRCRRCLAARRIRSGGAQRRTGQERPVVACDHRTDAACRWRASRRKSRRRDLVRVSGWAASRDRDTWLLTVVGAGVANLLESLLGPSSHQSVGASTAVFTTLGMMAAYLARAIWLPQRWARRWGPLVAGAILLGWMGSGGLRRIRQQLTFVGPVESGGTVDVVAHVSGFFMGAVLGVVVAIGRVRRAFQRVPQWASGAAALASIVAAWVFALRPSAFQRGALNRRAPGSRLCGPGWRA